MVGNTEENGPFWFVSLMMMVAALGSHSSQGLYANSSFCHQPHTREMGHLRLGLGRFSRRAELSCCFYPPPFWEWGREDLRRERERRGVPPQESHQSGRGAAAGADVKWRRMEKWEELEGAENARPDQEFKEQRKEKWGKGRRQTPTLFLEPEFSQP